MINTRRSLVGALLGVVFAGLAACGDGDNGSSADELRQTMISTCEAFADCTGNEVDGCVMSGEKQIDRAQANGCLPVVKAWFDCIEAHSKCVADAGFTDDDMCHDEEELGEDCASGRL
jgi:hypothetical protein